MFCCACAGTCNHVGNHSFCEAHGGTRYVAPIVTTNTSFTFEGNGGCPMGHDFAVGPTRAICNRCERVVPLGSDEPGGAS